MPKFTQIIVRFPPNFRKALKFSTKRMTNRLSFECITTISLFLLQFRLIPPKYRPFALSTAYEIRPTLQKKQNLGLS